MFFPLANVSSRVHEQATPSDPGQFPKQRPTRLKCLDAFGGATLNLPGAILTVPLDLGEKQGVCRALDIPLAQGVIPGVELRGRVHPTSLGAREQGTMLAKTCRCVHMCSIGEAFHFALPDVQICSFVLSFDGKGPSFCFARSGARKKGQTFFWLTLAGFLLRG